MDKGAIIRLMLLSLSFNIVLIGSFCNNAVIRLNNNQMPFIAVEGLHYDSGNSYIQIDDKSKVNAYYLADIFILNVGDHFFSYSIGDVIIILGGVFVVITLFNFNHYNYLKTKADKLQ